MIVIADPLHFTYPLWPATMQPKRSSLKRDESLQSSPGRRATANVLVSGDRSRVWRYFVTHL
jgi:hypothetical protein